MGRLVRGEEGGRGNKGSVIKRKITWLMDLVAVIKSMCMFLCMCNEDVRAAVLLGLHYKEKDRHCLVFFY